MDGLAKFNVNDFMTRWCLESMIECKKYKYTAVSLIECLPQGTILMIVGWLEIARRHLGFGAEDPKERLCHFSMFRNGHSALSIARISIRSMSNNLEQAIFTSEIRRKIFEVEVGMLWCH